MKYGTAFSSAALFVCLFCRCSSAPPPPLPDQPSEVAPVLPYPANADEAVKRALEGNARFVQGEGFGLFRHPAKATATSRPFLAVVSCSDSPLPDEVLLDQGPGDVFVVRNAGPSVDPQVVQSLRHAVDSLGVQAIFVVGHTPCSAAKASPMAAAFPAADHYIRRLVNRLRADRQLTAAEGKGRPLHIAGTLYQLPSAKLKLMDGNGQFW